MESKVFSFPEALKPVWATFLSTLFIFLYSILHLLIPIQTPYCLLFSKSHISAYLEANPRNLRIPGFHKYKPLHLFIHLFYLKAVRLNKVCERNSETYPSRLWTIISRFNIATKQLYLNLNIRVIALKSMSNLNHFNFRN